MPLVSPLSGLAKSHFIRGSKRISEAPKPSGAQTLLRRVFQTTNAKLLTLTRRYVKASTSTQNAMPNPLPAPLTFYPAYCFSLSPTHNTWARLTAADVHALRERTGFEGTSRYLHLTLCFGGCKSSSIRHPSCMVQTD